MRDASRLGGVVPIPGLRYRVDVLESMRAEQNRRRVPSQAERRLL
jgi:hypothetical protein